MLSLSSLLASCGSTFTETPKDLLYVNETQLAPRAAFLVGVSKTF